MSKVVSEPKFYTCNKCKESVMWNEIEHSMCPCCLRPLLKHKECGGIIIEKSSWIPKLRFT